jgi:tetratricopeptide (TPR) repeat protein
VNDGVPDVSVIVRSMARPTLDAALASLASQNGAALEVLVVAASGPTHPPLGQSCGPHALRLIASPDALQRSAAANAGLDAAHGEWITFLDDDDRFEPDHVGALLSAAKATRAANVITSYAKAVHRDGDVAMVGQPFSLAQLYERNFIHLSSALVSRSLITQGARFDESLDVLEDWDFMLQLAQRATFHFVPLASFQWNADAGESGAGRGANHDAAKFATFRDRVYAKWSAPHDALISRTQPLLERALDAARQRRFDEARALCHDVLAFSPSDPWALNLEAMVLGRQGRVDEARSVQSLAVAVRPQDASFVYNLAQLDRTAGDLEGARRNARKASELAPDFAPARALIDQLG